MGVDVRSTSPTRRALGLLAVGTLGMSTAVLTATGVAQAAPPSWSASGSGDTAAVPSGICAIEWTVQGGEGGALSASPGTPGGSGGLLNVTLPATAGDVYTLYPGPSGNTGIPGGYAPAALSGSGIPGSDGGVPTIIGAGSGGAASVVIKGSSVVASAFGGTGAGGGSGGGNGVNTAPDGSDFDATGTGAGGAGAITGTGIACTPGTPYLEEWIEPGDGSLTIEWHVPTGGDVAAAGYEYSTNGSPWTPIRRPAAGYGDRLAHTITKLTNGTEYGVRVRAVSADGAPGAASVEQKATPFKAAGAPTHVVVTTGPSALTVTWGAAPTGGSAISKYVVELTWSRGEMGGGTLFCQTDASGRGCTAAAAPGTTHNVVVYAVDSNGRQGEWARVTSGVVPVSATVPTSNGDLTPAAGSTGSVTPGTKVTLSGTGYMPNSTVTLLVYSEPQVLTTVVTDGTGSFTVEVTVPDGLAAGQHTVVASGIDPLGNVRTMTLPITVTGGTTGSGGTTGAGGLAYTGADIAGPMIGGVAALAVGAGLLVAARRRSAA